MNLKQYQLNSIISNHNIDLKKSLVKLLTLELNILDKLEEKEDKYFKLYLPELFDLINVISYELNYLVDNIPILTEVRSPDLIVLDLISLTDLLLRLNWKPTGIDCELELINLYYFFLQLIYSLGYRLEDVISD